MILSSCYYLKQKKQDLFLMLPLLIKVLIVTVIHLF